MLDKLCERCNICWNLLPQPKSPPVLSIKGEEDEKPAAILVIDDCSIIAHYGECLDVVHGWLGGKIAFDYTTTIRCDHRPQKLEAEVIEQIVAKCSVWTHGIAEGRKIILATERGLRQLKVKNEHKEGDVFRNARLGVVVVIPSLINVHPRSEEFRTFKSKVERALKEVGL